MESKWQHTATLIRSSSRSDGWKILFNQKHPPSTKTAPTILGMESFLDKCCAFNDSLFPASAPTLSPLPEGWLKEPLTDLSENFDPIEPGNVSSALASCPDSAPGIDQIPYSILHGTHTAHPGLLTWVYNNLAFHGSIPKCWKSSRDVLVPKPSKESYDSPG
jgi:hypothetical protein